MIISKKNGPKKAYYELSFISNVLSLHMRILFIKEGWSVSNGLLYEKKKRIPNLFSISFIKKAGAEGQNRTADTGIFSPLLYRLSYLGMRILG